MLRTPGTRQGVLMQDFFHPQLRFSWVSQVESLWGPCCRGQPVSESCACAHVMILWLFRACSRERGSRPEVSVPRFAPRQQRVAAVGQGEFHVHRGMGEQRLRLAFPHAPPAGSDMVLQ